jgi:hypothetical protein
VEDHHLFHPHNKDNRFYNHLPLLRLEEITRVISSTHPKTPTMEITPIYDVGV